MADIPGDIDKINDIEVASDAPLTEALHFKYGANINALIDSDLFAVQEITSVGAGSFIVPAGVEYLFILACGGGGGGGGGARTSDWAGGGGGGQGGSIMTLQMKVSPAQSIPYTVGAGGSGGAPGSPVGGNGANGGNTVWNNFIVNGGVGGTGNPATANSLDFKPNDGSAEVFQRFLCGFGGGRGRNPASTAATGTVSVSEAGQSSPYASGGSAGTSTGINDAGGGGGGGASIGAGGSGGNGTNGGTSQSGGAGTRGGGGGGGGGNGNAGGIAGAGGIGGNGIIIIGYSKADFTNV